MSIAGSLKKQFDLGDPVVEEGRSMYQNVIPLHWRKHYTRKDPMFQILSGVEMLLYYL